MGGNELPHLPPNQLWVGHCYEPLTYSHTSSPVASLTSVVWDSSNCFFLSSFMPTVAITLFKCVIYY